MDSTLLSLREQVDKIEKLHRDGLKAEDIVRRAKAEASDYHSMRRYIEGERYLVLKPLNRFTKEVSGKSRNESKSFINATTVIIFGFVTGYILWIFLESLVWKSGLVGLLAIVIGCEIVIAFLMSKDADERMLSIVNGAYIDGVEYEAVNHYAEAYKKALDEIKKL